MSKVVSQKNKELFELMDKLHEHKELLEKYAIKRNEFGNLYSNRLDQIGKHAMEIYLVSSEIISHVQSMRRR